MIKPVIVILVLWPYTGPLVAQSDSSVVNTLDGISGNNVFTRGLFMSKGRVELKIFNNLYTEVTPYHERFNKRNSFFTAFLQLTVGSNRNINYGIDLLYRSNVTDDLAGNSPFRILSFDNRSEVNVYQGEQITTNFNHGLSHIGGRIRTKPFKEKRVTFQQAVYVPARPNGSAGRTGSIDGGWIINTDLFFEHLAANNKLMLFGDMGVWYNTSRLPFPYLKVFAGTFIAGRFGPYLMLNLPYEIGPGLKFFIFPKIELEFLYTWWLPLEWTVQDRRPQSFNLGWRLTSFNNFYRK